MKPSPAAPPHGVGPRATAGVWAGNELRPVAGAIAKVLRPTTPLCRVGHTFSGLGRGRASSPENARTNTPPVSPALVFNVLVTHAHRETEHCVVPFFRAAPGVKAGDREDIAVQPLTTIPVANIEQVQRAAGG